MRGKQINSNKRSIIYVIFIISVILISYVLDVFLYHNFRNISENEFLLILIFLSLLVILTMIFIWKFRKIHSNVLQTQPLTRISQPTNLECPKCGSKLNSTPGQFPPLYACPNCGYHGPVALEPEGKKSKRK